MRGKNGVRNGVGRCSRHKIHYQTLDNTGTPPVRGYGSLGPRLRVPPPHSKHEIPELPRGVEMTNTKPIETTHYTNATCVKELERIHRKALSDSPRGQLAKALTDLRQAIAKEIAPLLDRLDRRIRRRGNSGCPEMRKRT